MKLQPGLYKLRSRSRFDPECVYLHVSSNGKKLYYTINGGAGSPADDYNNIDIDGYELVKQLREPIVAKASITINWTDPDGDSYSKKGNAQEISSFLKTYPQIAKAIGSEKY